MHMKAARSGGNPYAQPAESYRHDKGKPCQRVIANPGRQDDSASWPDAMLARCHSCSPASGSGPEARDAVRLAGSSPA